MSMKNSSDPIGIRTRDLPVCSAVPRTIAPPRAPQYPITVTYITGGTPCLFIDSVFHVGHVYKPYNNSSFVRSVSTRTSELDNTIEFRIFCA
jgi:hypothetical protein